MPVRFLIPGAVLAWTAGQASAASFLVQDVAFVRVLEEPEVATFPVLLAAWADSYRHFAINSVTPDLAAIGFQLIALAGLSLGLARRLPHNRRRARDSRFQVSRAARAMSRRR